MKTYITNAWEFKNDYICDESELSNHPWKQDVKLSITIDALSMIDEYDNHSIAEVFLTKNNDIAVCIKDYQFINNETLHEIINDSIKQLKHFNEEIVVNRFSLILFLQEMIESECWNADYMEKECKRVEKWQNKTYDEVLAIWPHSLYEWFTPCKERRGIFNESN